MNWRLASRLSVITLAILVVIIVTVWQRNGDGASSTSLANGNGSDLQGTDLGKAPAPNFQLLDQNGQHVALTQFKGQPVILTFLYTHCPDVCPLTAEKLHTAMLGLKNDAHKVGVIAVSTDPAHDNQAAARAFSKAHNMQDYWHFLIGSQQQLAPVWKDYNIYAQAYQQSVDHTAAVYLIDKQGTERVFFDSNFTPAQVTADIQKLLKE